MHVGVSELTVTRRRINLEKEGFLEYTAIPNFGKLGFDIISFTFGKGNSRACRDLIMSQKFRKEGREYLSDWPNMIFVSSGRGLGKDSINITLHRSYSDYVDYMKNREQKWGEFLDIIDSFVISLRSDNILRPLTLKYLGEHIKKDT